jgi:hypothetical protein
VYQIRPKRLALETNPADARGPTCIAMAPLTTQRPTNVPPLPSAFTRFDAHSATIAALHWGWDDAFSASLNDIDLQHHSHFKGGARALRASSLARRAAIKAGLDPAKESAAPMTMVMSNGTGILAPFGKARPAPWI